MRGMSVNHILAAGFHFHIALALLNKAPNRSLLIHWTFDTRLLCAANGDV